MLVFDSSTLILLAKSELLDLFLEDFQGTPRVPGAVEAESTQDKSRPDAVLIRQRIQEGRLVVESVRSPQILARLLEDFRLGSGEAEALVLALESDPVASLATDDRNAIRACKVLHVRFVTSLAILGQAVEKGLLTREDGLRALDRLRYYGRFRAEIVEEFVLRIGGTKNGEGSENG